MSFYVWETRHEKGENDVEKVLITREQARMIDNHSEDFRLLMDKRHSKNCPTVLDSLSIEDVVNAFFDGYEIEPEYKVGDWAFRLSKHSFENVGEGYIFRIYDVSADAVKAENLVIHYKNEVRHATPEEIRTEKERRLWKKLDREYLEFKVGDAYENVNGLVHTVDKDERIPIVRGIYEKGRIKGFYPAESFISFEDGEES